MRTIVLGVKYFFLSKSQIISIIVNYIYIYIYIYIFFFSRSCQIIRLVEKSGGKYQPADSLLIHQPNNPSCLSTVFLSNQTGLLIFLSIIPRMENRGRKKRRLQRTKSNREWCSSSLDANTIFALMLAAICNSNEPYSESVIKRCLNSLHLSLIPNSQNAAFRLHQTLPIPILSLLPILLNSK